MGIPYGLQYIIHHVLFFLFSSMGLTEECTYTHNFMHGRVYLILYMNKFRYSYLILFHGTNVDFTGWILVLLARVAEPQSRPEPSYFGLDPDRNSTPGFLKPIAGADHKRLCNIVKVIIFIWSSLNVSLFTIRCTVQYMYLKCSSSTIFTCYYLCSSFNWQL